MRSERPNFTDITLGCSCVVSGVLHDEVPHIATLVAVDRFRNYCMKHVMSAVRRGSGRHRNRYNVKWRDGKLGRLKVPGHHLWWYDLKTGEPVREEVWRAWSAAEDELRRPAREAQAEVDRQVRLHDEAFLLDHGWVKEDVDVWTAPKAIQDGRAFRGRGYYVRTSFKHALNTQRLVDRAGMTALAKGELR